MREMPQRESNRGDASLTSHFRRVCGCWLFGRTRRRGFAFDVVSVPGEVALEAVLYMRGRGEAVMLAGVDDKLGGTAEHFQRLVHLRSEERRVGKECRSR